MSIEEDNPKKKPDIKQDDLLNLNETTTESEQTTTQPTIESSTPELEQQSQDKFDINAYTGFPMESWVRYQGTINDNKQRRRVSIANIDKYKLRYNSSDDNDIPTWDILELQYHPVTVQAWQKRQNDSAELEDKQREIGAIDLQLAEIQNSIRQRALQSAGMMQKNPTNQSLEELQRNVQYISNLGKNLKKEFQDRKNQADKYAFKIYFHQKPELFDKIRADDIDDVIGACDWKQLNGPTNLRPSEPLSTKAQAGIT